MKWLVLVWLFVGDVYAANNLTPCSNNSHFGCSVSSFGSGITLVADNTQRYFPVNGMLTASTTLANHQLIAPGDMTVYGLSCALTAAPTGATKTRTFTLGTGATPTTTAITCTITDTATSCTYNASTVAITKGTAIVMISTAANTPNAASVGCQLFYTVDVFK